MTTAQALADLVAWAILFSSRQPEQGTGLEQMHRRYLQAPAPQKGAKVSVAYRLRLFFALQEGSGL